MRGRSHRHSVPTARPSAQAAGEIYLWGRGKIGADLRGYLHDERASVAEHDDVARKLAIEHGCPVDIVPDAWAWRVDGASSRIIDLMTRDDPHVFGWTAFRRETCAPSLALRNALNALSAQEIADAAGVLTERFAKTGPNAGNGSEWVAKDNRVVFYDEDAGEWSLGDYAGAV